MSPGFDSRLRDSLHRAVESAHIGVWQLDPRSGRLEWSPSLFDIYGLSKDRFDASVAGWLSSIHPDDHERVHDGVARSLKGEPINNLRFRISRPNGEVRHLSASCSPLFNPQGDLVGLIGINIDETEYRKGEERFRQQETLHRAVFDSELIGMLIADASGRSLSVNRVAQKLFGLSEDRILGRPLNELETVDKITSVSRSQANLDKARDEGEIEIRHSDGGQRLASYYSVRIAENLHFSLFDDVTEARRREFQVRQAQKMEAVGRLAGAMAHRLNNAMTVIKNCTALLDDELELQDPRRELVEPIREACARATDLVRHLLAFGRPSPANREPLCLNEVLVGIDGLLNRLGGGQGPNRARSWRLGTHGSR